jgi:nucleoid-associated protein YgaU
MGLEEHMITLSSRYKTTTAEDGQVISIRKTVAPTTYTVYTVRDGDTLDLLATSMYGDPTLYWRIADMNPHIAFPDLLQVGDVLRLPE